MILNSKYWVLSLVLVSVWWVGMPHSKASANSAIDPKVLHVLNRLTFGPRPGDIDTVNRMGIEAYIQSQLAPKSIPEPQFLTQQLKSFKTLHLSPAELKMAVDPARQPLDGQQPNPQAMKAAANKEDALIRQQAVAGHLLPALASPRQLQEVMVDFWFNHFNVFAGKGLDRLWVGAYEEQAIRPYVFSRFRDLLGATAHHPAMLYYLDNGQNAAGKLNENYARELMELHTLGVDGGYTQKDVIALARILSGWGITRPQQVAGNRKLPPIEGEFYFNPKRHDFGDKVFLGQTIKGSGIAEGQQALDILAHHPATARHISYQLIQYFLTDDPPPSLVRQLTLRFLETDGDIREVLNTLFHSPEFWDSKYYNAKLKTPYQYVISTIRATGTVVKNLDRVNNILNQLGMPLYGCQFPDGYKNTAEAWLNPDAMLRRISFSTALASGGFDGAKSADAEQLDKTLGDNFSSETKDVIANSPAQMRAALMLGSPEFMRH